MADKCEGVKYSSTFIANQIDKPVSIVKGRFSAFKGTISGHKIELKLI